MKKRTGRSDKGRTILSEYDEEPKSARRDQRCWQLWRLCKDLDPIEITILITKRKGELKHTKNKDKIKILRTDISILEDSYRIISRKREFDND